MFDITDQIVSGQATLPSEITDGDAWLASKINFTRKDKTSSELYNEIINRPDPEKFIRGVRDNSIKRLHLGAYVVQSMEYNFKTSSLVSMAFANGKFYNMQQQTRRSVVLDSVINVPEITNNTAIQDNYKKRFELYNHVIEQRDDKVQGFDRYIQDIFKILPLNTQTRIVANLSLRTSKQYSRWRGLGYLPTTLQDFGSKIEEQIWTQFPIMGNTTIPKFPLVNSGVKSDPLTDSKLWYADHSFLSPDPTSFLHYYYRPYELYDLEIGQSKLMSYNMTCSLDEVYEYLENTSDMNKAVLELSNFTVATMIDLSGAIDTWRHTQNRRMVQPIYHAVENNPLVMPELFQKQEKLSGNTEVSQRLMNLSEETVELYNELKDEIDKKELINILPHNLGIIQIETMDLFSFLQMVGQRTCIHARPEVQTWAYSIIREVNKIPHMRGIAKILEDGSLPRAKQLGYCPEYKACSRCGNEITQLVVK